MRLDGLSLAWSSGLGSFRVCCRDGSRDYNIGRHGRPEDVDRVVVYFG